LDKVMPSEKDPVKEMLTDETGSGGLIPEAAAAANRKLGVLGKLTKFEIADRRRKVMRLRLRGLGIPQIAKVIQIPESTVESDLVEVQKINQQTIDKFEKNQFIGESLSIFTELEEKAWAEFNATEPGTSHRLKSLELIRSLNKDKIDALVDTGVIKKAEESQVIEHHHSIKWDDDLKSKIAKAMLEASLKTKLLEPTPEIYTQPQVDIVQSVEEVTTDVESTMSGETDELKQEEINNEEIED
jgi:hypothetical protein